MKRFALGIATGLSLLVALTAAGAWLLSYARTRSVLIKYELHRSWQLATLPNGTPAGSLARYADLSLPRGYWRAWYFANVRGRLVLTRHNVDLGPTGGIVAFAPDVLTAYEHVGFGEVTGDGPGGVSWKEVPYKDVWGLSWKELPIVVRNPLRDPDNLREGAGFARTEAAWNFPNASGRVTLVMLPHWAFVLLGTPLPLLVLKSRLRRRRLIRQGRCLRCGYDLRESPDRCPECGRLANE